MRKIAVLSQNTIDKIAAGEVVERPASVVKELVENAIDAAASAITVEIRDGGSTLIRITDNGGGIDPEQVPLAFLRHATSKLTNIGDLLQISTLGFRGEALSSIAAVSQIELITKMPEAITGIRYIIEGGTEKSLEEIGAPDGTTILVRNLFFNTPARAKFLKSAVTETGYISNYLEQLALSHADISFKYVVNGQNKMHTSGNANLKDVIYHIYGRELTRELVELDVQKEGLSMSGFIGKPSISRGNRSFENCYVNGRYVKSKLLSKAIEDAYKPFLMQHRYPFTAFHLDLTGDELDVNVHPAKLEVRFQDQERVYREVCDAIGEALSRRELIPDASLEKPSREKRTEGKKQDAAPEPFEIQRRKATGKSGTEVPPGSSVYEREIRKRAEAEMIRESTETGMFRKDSEPDMMREATESGMIRKDSEPGVIRETPVYQTKDKANDKEKTPRGDQLELFERRLLSEESRKSHRILGQVFDTYWIVTWEDKLFIIDQHAAHEKVLYERIVKAVNAREVNSQLLSPPLIVTVTLSQEGILKEHRELFTSFGFAIEPFGGHEYAISAVPENLYGLTSEGMFTELLDQLDSETGEISVDLFSQRLATMACKAAVKGNQHLAAAEAETLIDELLTLENPYQCPHGRPTIISMSRYELEKKFKRVL